MVRWEILLMVMGLFTPLVLFQLKDKFAPNIKFYAYFLGTIFLICSGLRFWEHSTYANDKEWQEHISIHKYITQIIDFDALEHINQIERNKIFDKFGWSETDYSMVRRWFYLDTVIYSQKNLKGILDEEKFSKDTIDYLSGPKMTIYILLSGMGRGLLIFGLAVLFYTGVKFKSVFSMEFKALFLSCITVIAFIFYLCYFKKPPPERIHFGLIFYMTLILFGTFAAGNPSGFALKSIWGNMPLKIISILLFLQLSFATVGYFEMSHRIRVNNNQLHQFFSNLTPNHENLYVNWGDSFPWEYVMPLENIFYLKNFKCFDLGGSERAPFAYEILRQYNIRNLYTAIAQNKLVYLVISDSRKKHLDIYLDFMQEHYSIKLNPLVREKYMNFTVFQFSTETN